MNFNQCNVVYFLETHQGPEKIGLINISKSKWVFHPKIIFHPCDFTFGFLDFTIYFMIATVHGTQVQDCLIPAVLLVHAYLIEKNKFLNFGISNHSMALLNHS